MGNFEAPGRDLVTLHVYSAPPLAWRFYEVRETTLADHDRLIRKPARTVRVDLADLAPARPMGRKVKGGSHVSGMTLETRRPVIAVIGGGFTGTMVAVHLARPAGSARSGSC